jgi:acyl carrier protein
MITRIRRAFCEVFDDPRLEINEDTSPRELPAWDSFAQVKLLLALEEEFGVQFTPAEAAELYSVGDFRRALEARHVSA